MQRNCCKGTAAKGTAWLMRCETDTALSCSVKWNRKLTIMNYSTPTTVLLALLLLMLAPGVKVGTISINERRPFQRMFHRHQRFQQLGVIPNFFNGHGKQNASKPQISSKDRTWPHVTYSGNEGSRDILRHQTIIDHLVGFMISLPSDGSLKNAGARWRNLKNSINRRMDSFITGRNEPRKFFFTSVDDWASAFQQSMKRDAVYNIGKVGGLIILYYFFPGILSWITDMFGSF